jgi:cyclophilin family peptidyl-prolyl cis-trans isomerase
MKKAVAVLTVVAICGVTLRSQLLRVAAQAPPAPVIAVDTSKGTFMIETYPDQAPATVAHVVALVKRGFYDGQRVHRALPGFLVQFGDPQSRNLDARPMWGRGAAAASGIPVGVAEVSNKRTHRPGAVGLSHPGVPTAADSQIYVMLDRRPDLDGRYAVFGQVISGEDVPSSLDVGDLIVRVYLRD